jgi:Fe-S-cluster-containing dehydrogenase component/formate-dependent nitrite reductase membrane component NrfD
VPRYGWVIDQTTCIGCHACTTACKAEHEVPLGVERTWVKYVEQGTYPATARHFAVLRCNHCAEPPCVAVCPVRAMYQRPDGIVDFDTGRCIGCKACLQACPYDAIYIDPEQHVAQKCDFCSHRVDAGRLPACVVVCPTESLTFGDLDDPTSRAARIVAERPTSVRRPEQGTRPQAHYVGASPIVLDPLASMRGGQYVWADRRTDDRDAAGPAGLAGTLLPVVAASASHHAAPGAADAPPRVAYDVFHARPWGWRVALYLWTKGLGAGAFGVLFAALAVGLVTADRLVALAAAFASLVGVGLTALLLVADLKRPERFWTILVRPQWRSWLAIGAFILVGYSILLGLWFLGQLVGVDGALLGVLGWPTLGLGAASALYTALLLGQCEARDLWQRPSSWPALAGQAVLLGAAAVLLIALGLPAIEAVAAPSLSALGLPLAAATDAAARAGQLADAGRLALAAGGLLHLVALLGGEVALEHPTANGRAAAALLVAGPWRAGFWLGGVGLGGLLPLFVALAASVSAAGAAPGAESIGVLALAGLGAAAGLLWYERAYLAAGQAVPIS